MATHSRAEIPAGMQGICRRFERWRSSHPGRLPIPEVLWSAAAETARKHGVSATAEILGLEYRKLKRMAASVVNAPTPQPRFLELAPLPSAGRSECVMELEGRRVKLHLHLKGSTAEDIVRLSRALWEVAS